MAYERITDDEQFDGTRESHIYRYKWAARFIEEEDVVLDAACGTGYGAEYLPGSYVGVDKDELGQKFVADLETWKPDFEFDVFVGLETIEHLGDYSNYVDIAKRARKYIIISTPIIPNKNPYHLQQFSKQDIIDLFSDQELEEYEEQDKRYGIFAFKKVGKNG